MKKTFLATLTILVASYSHTAFALDTSPPLDLKKAHVTISELKDKESWVSSDGHTVYYNREDHKHSLHDLLIDSLKKTTHVNDSKILEEYLQQLLKK